jgi:hypothetical protein
MAVGVIVSVIVITIASLIFINCNRIWIKHHPLTHLTPLDQIGPFLGGISLFFATIVAWVTAFIITWRNARLERYMTAVNSFRSLYEAFWKSDDISDARKWIISADEYAKILKPVLENRNRQPLNQLDKDKFGWPLNQLDKYQNDVLETLDKFLAVLVRIKSFSISGELDYIPEAQQILWGKVIHASFWIDFAYNHRLELWVYLHRHWDELIPPGSPEVPDPRQELKLEGYL